MTLTTLTTSAAVLRRVLTILPGRFSSCPRCNAVLANCQVSQATVPRPSGISGQARVAAHFALTVDEVFSLVVSHEEDIQDKAAAFLAPQ